MARLYPGPFCDLSTPRVFRRSRGRHVCGLAPPCCALCVRSCSGFEPASRRQCAIDALSGPFLESEIEVSCGQAAAQHLRESTGRTGLLDKIFRVGQSLGLTNDEMEVKGAYEKALRDGHVVAALSALLSGEAPQRSDPPWKLRLRPPTRPRAGSFARTR
jgi:hypothetical protein